MNRSKFVSSSMPRSIIPLDFAIVLLVFVCLAGCASAPGPPTTSTVLGRVVLVDSTGQVLSDSSGATVRLDNTTFSAITDVSGRWTIHDVPHGVYNVTFSKPGFGTFHRYFDYYYNVKEVIQPIGIARMPNRRVVINSATWLDSTSEHFTTLIVHLDTINTTSGFSVYCDLDSTVQPGDHHFLLLNPAYWDNRPATVTDKYTFLNAGIQPGQTVYVSASQVFSSPRNDTGYYNWPGYFLTGYMDSSGGQYRYSSTGPRSNVIAVKIP